MKLIERLANDPDLTLVNTEDKTDEETGAAVRVFSYEDKNDPDVLSLTLVVGLGGIFMRNEFVEGRVEQADGHGQTFHRLEDADEVLLLEGFDLGEPGNSHHCILSGRRRLGDRCYIDVY